MFFSNSEETKQEDTQESSNKSEITELAKEQTELAQEKILNEEEQKQQNSLTNLQEPNEEEQKQQNSLTNLQEARQIDQISPSTNNSASTNNSPTTNNSPEFLKYLKIAEDTKQTLEQMAQLTTQNNWSLKDNSNGYQIHTTVDAKSGNTLSRGEGVIPYPIEQIYEILHHVDKRGDYDDQFEKGNFVKNLGEDFNIIYQKFKSIFVVSSRDFVLLTKKFVNKDNSITITASSIDYPEVGEKKGVVRGNIDFGGWILTPLENNTKTHAIFIVLIDPKGNVPTMVVASTMKQQGQCVEKVKKLLDKNNKKKSK